MPRRGAGGAIHKGAGGASKGPAPGRGAWVRPMAWASANANRHRHGQEEHNSYAARKGINSKGNLIDINFLFDSRTHIFTQVFVTHFRRKVLDANKYAIFSKTH